MRDYLYVPYGSLVSLAPGGPEPLITVHERDNEYEARASWASERRSLSVFAPSIEEAMKELEGSLAAPPLPGYHFRRVEPTPRRPSE